MRFIKICRDFLVIPGEPDKGVELGFKLGGNLAQMGSGEVKKTMSPIREAVLSAKIGAPWKRSDPPMMVIWVGLPVEVRWRFFRSV